MILPDTLRFLENLSKNNNREWFLAHKEEYLAAKSNFEETVDTLIRTLGKHTPALLELRASDCTFRIYRDVRFSKNKDPYKAHFSASIKAGGKKSSTCGFYIHLEPGGPWGCFVAGGFYLPEPAILKKILQEIDYNTEEFLSILEQPAFKKSFGELEKDHQLKRMPKGMGIDHPAAEYMKLKSFLVTHELDFSAAGKQQLLKQSEKAYCAMLPFLDFLNRSLD
jgi:uncharacterized protein (TIGR02453 family)